MVSPVFFRPYQLFLKGDVTMSSFSHCLLSQPLRSRFEYYNQNGEGVGRYLFLSRMPALSQCMWSKFTLCIHTMWPCCLASCFLQGGDMVTFHVLPHQKCDSKNVWVKYTLIVAYLTHIEMCSKRVLSCSVEAKNGVGWGEREEREREAKRQRLTLCVCVFVYSPVLQA